MRVIRVGDYGKKWMGSLGDIWIDLDRVAVITNQMSGTGTTSETSCQVTLDSGFTLIAGIPAATLAEMVQTFRKTTDAQ